MEYIERLRQRFAEKKNQSLSNQTFQTPDQNSNSVSSEKFNTKGKMMAAPDDFSKVIDNCFEKLDVEKNIKDTIKKTIVLNFDEHLATSKLKERLQLLFEYEKNYLMLIKEFKEEIKFVGSLQEDLRKERAKFFSDTLQEVSAALKDSQVSNDVASQWIQELVNSYTKSLDVSSGLIEEHTFDTIGDIRRQAKGEINTVTKKEANE
jgi:hypothetical protein